jgi:hypothetical protein
MARCNGRDHKWNCTCGFGGARGAKPLPEQLRELFVPKIPRRYTKPNDRCSFCDAPVFFRALQHGGRAYFDDAGAPWRKHPCLDQESPLFLGSVADSELHWPQLHNASTHPAGRDFIELRGSLRGEKWSGYLQVRSLQALFIDVAALENSFVQVRQNAPTGFDVALLTEKLAKFLVRTSSTMRRVAIQSSVEPRKTSGQARSELASVHQADLWK